MAILVDMNQISVASVIMHLHMTKQTKPDEDMVRHMILNSLRMYRMKFCDEYGELVLCYDSKHYWRRDYYPEYKHNRKKGRESSANDWDAIFEVLNAVKAELKEFFPYKHLEVYGAEADDIIAALCGELEFDNGKTLILSGDKDFGQLQKYVNVEQFSPITKRWIRVADPRRFLKEHIMKGDRGDGIPNFLSNDSCIVAHERQKPLSSKKLDKWVDLEPENFCTNEMLRNYRRNEQLVDLDCVPQEITKQVIDQYTNYEVPDRRGLLNYFIKKKLKLLTEHVGDF